MALVESIKKRATMTPALEQLEAQVARDLETLRYPGKTWLQPVEAPNGETAYDVVVIGAGQSGLSLAASLKREKVERVLVLDKSEEGLEGPWVTFARMHTLRTPKHLAGTELGIPSLSSAEWYRARYGDAAWEALGKIDRADWMEYLYWFRKVLELTVINETQLTHFETTGAAGNLLKLITTSPQGESVFYTRRLVFATGIDGAGQWYVPDFVKDNVSRSLYGHTSDLIDYSQYEGKSIGVLGAGASAFDNAGTALEAGAARVDLFYRRKRLPRVNPNRWMENMGFLAHYADMSDAWKWRFYKQFWGGNQPPPQDTFERCTAFPHFNLKPGTTWDTVAEKDGKVIVQSGEQTFEYDFIILGTGLNFDLKLRPEFSSYADKIALWGDRYSPAPGEEDPVFAGMPYLGKSCEFLEKEEGTLPWVGKVYCFNYGANLSMGMVGSALSGLKFGLRHLVQGITRSLYLEDLELTFEDLRNYKDPELTAPDDV